MTSEQQNPRRDALLQLTRAIGAMSTKVAHLLVFRRIISPAAGGNPALLKGFPEDVRAARRELKKCCDSEILRKEVIEINGKKRTLYLPVERTNKHILSSWQFLDLIDHTLGAGFEVYWSPPKDDDATRLDPAQNVPSDLVFFAARRSKQITVKVLRKGERTFGLPAAKSRSALVLRLPNRWSEKKGSWVPSSDEEKAALEGAAEEAKRLGYRLVIFGGSAGHVCV